MITIEDGATVNANYQAHSFEDRVLKLAPVVVRRGATIGESAVLFYGADVGASAWVTPNSVVMKNERLSPARAYGGCPVQALGDAGPSAPSATPTPASATSAPPAARGPSPDTRYPSLDIARGLAVLGMIYMHLVSAEATGTGLTGASSGFAGFLEGKSAALFCVLAGMAWEIQARRAARSPRNRWYFARRVLTLLAGGVVFHLVAWPTEILVPFSLMMVVSLVMRRVGRGAVVCTAALALLLAPVVPAFFGHFVESDWTSDGSHAADGSFGWVTLRYLALDGNYPLVPWLAFPLLGMLMMGPSWDNPRRFRRWFGPAFLLYLVSQAYMFWADANADSLGALSPYLTSTWVPTSLPFVVVTGSWSVAVITGLAWWQGSTRPAGAAALAAMLGRSSLTHYVFHVCLLYVPLRIVLGHEEWSVEVGVWAFAAYLAVAVPLTALWFRRFQRGPLEGLWALASGR
jgi:uncharacterized membrane protein YeiB